MGYFSGQGRVYLAKRDNNGNPEALRWVGNVPDLKISLNTEVMEHKESSSGQRLTDLQIVTSKDGEFSCTFESFDRANLELSLYGVTNEVAADAAVSEALPSGIMIGELRTLAHPFVDPESVVVTDSAGVPVTVPGTKYVIHANQGAISFSDVSGYTQPFKVSYDYGAASEVAMFRAAQPEVWLRFDGVNTADANKPVVVDLYRVAVNPTKDLSLISDDIQKFELTGKVLADTGRAADGDLGQFGRIILQG